MFSEFIHPDIEALSALYLLDRLTPLELAIAADTVGMQRAAKGSDLAKFENDEQFAIYIVRGSVELKNLQSGKSVVIEDGTARANEPLAHLSAELHQVICLRDVEYVRIPQYVLSNLVQRKRLEDLGPIKKHEDLQDDPLYKKIYDDLIDDRLIIPELPDVAKKLSLAIQQEEDVKRIQAIVQNDPGLAAMIMRTANSALYRTGKPVQSLVAAINRIGLNTVRTLAIKFSMRGFFVSDNSCYNRKIQDLWRHSIEVASLSYILAKQIKGFVPDHCLLLGLLHNIGAYPVLRYMDAERIQPKSMQHLDAVVNRLQPAVSALILEKWEFGTEFSNVALNAVNWNYDSIPGPDECDLVQMAKIHSIMSHELMSESLEMKISELPIIHLIPAFNKLGLNQLTPQSAVNFLQQAKQEMLDTMQMLAA